MTDQDVMFDLTVNDDEAELLIVALKVSIESPYVSGMICGDMERLKTMIEAELAKALKEADE